MGREIPWVVTAPPEAIRRQLRVTVQPIDGPGDASRLLNVVEQLGSEDMLLFSSDYPHRYAQGFEEAFGGLLEPGRERAILRTNATRLYRL